MLAVRSRGIVSRVVDVLPRDGLAPVRSPSAQDVGAQRLNVDAAGRLIGEFAVGSLDTDPRWIVVGFTDPDSRWIVVGFTDPDSPRARRGQHRPAALRLGRGSTGPDALRLVAGGAAPSS